MSAKDPILTFWRRRHNKPVEEKPKEAAVAPQAEAVKEDAPRPGPLTHRGSWSGAMFDMAAKQQRDRADSVESAPDEARASTEMPNMERKGSQQYEDDICIYGF